jgi:hypothetical protein
LPGGGRSCSRPRRRLFRRLRGSRRGDEGSHLSGGARPPSLSSSSSPDDEYSSVPSEESPCCSRSRNSSLLRSRRSRRRMLRSLLCVIRSCSHRCAVRACARSRGVGGSDRAAFTTLICKEQEKLQNTPTSREPAEQGGSPLTNGPTGSMVNAQRAASSFRLVQRLMARRARVAAYSRGKRPSINRDCASATGSASSCISKMRSYLSIRGTTRR